MKNALGLVCGVLVLSCAGTPPPPADPPPPAATAAPTAAPATTPVPVATAAPATTAPDERDPDLLKLARLAAKCPLDEDDFDPACPAFKAWWDLGMGGELAPYLSTLLALLEDPDEKIRLLVARPGMQDTGEFFNEPVRARRIIAVAKKETNSWVQHEISHQIARIDAEKHGLAAEVRELAKIPGLRVGLASSVEYHATPLVLELTRAFLQDPSENVRKAAAMSLGGRTPTDPPRPEPVCKLITEQLGRTDVEVWEVFASAPASGCTGMPDAVITEVGKRTADPLKVPDALAIGYLLGVDLACQRSKSEDVKKQGYKIAIAFTSPKVKASRARVLAAGSLASCDKTLAKKDLQKLTKDKDKDVAQHAEAVLKDMQARP